MLEVLLGNKPVKLKVLGAPIHVIVGCVIEPNVEGVNIFKLTELVLVHPKAFEAVSV